MSILKFTEIFPTEKSCRDYLKNRREEQGITCDECGSKNHFWLESIEKWQCRNCNSRTNLRSGTVMEKSKIPVRTWFMCIHLMTTIKKSFSALEMQRQLGLKRYQPVFEMMTKIRKSMGKRDSRYKLQGSIEMDDAFFTTVDLPEKDRLGNVIQPPKAQQRGRGSNRKMEVLVMVESTPVMIKPKSRHKKTRAMGFAKMIVMDDLNNTGINYTVKKSVSSKAKVVTDSYRGYSKLTQVVQKHTSMVVPPAKAMDVLPWVHAVISNAKRQFNGVHHSIGKDFLQGYLDEFCYKLNRRNFQDDLFDRMITAGSSDTWY